MNHAVGALRRSPQYVELRKPATHRLGAGLPQGSHRPLGSRQPNHVMPILEQLPNHSRPDQTRTASNEDAHKTPLM
ncbi:hypothetical protein GCM10009630_41860 [Kribbella jejuensis]